MATSFDSLNIAIKADVSSAARSINNLNKKLQLLNTTLSQIDASKIKNVADSFNNINISGLSSLTKELKSLNDSVKSLQNGINLNITKNFKNVGNAGKVGANGLKLFNSSALQLGKTSRSLAYSFGKFYANFFILVRGIKALWNGVKSSMDYVETYNYFKVTLSKMGSTMASKMGEYGSDSAESYVDKFTSRLNDLNKKMTGYETGANGELVSTGMANLGLDPNQLQQFQAKIGAITTSVGLIGDSASYAQKALSMLSADLSSLTNTDLDTVMTNLSSGMIGQSRALYKYGIDITSASLAQEALANGVTKSVAEMTQAEKMQLRLLVILKNSSIAWGDQANTINSVANQYRIFTQQVQNLGRVLGNLFLPIIQKVLPWVNGLIIALQRLFTTFGLKLWGDNWLTDIMDGISGGATSDIDDLGDELDDAAKSATKLKKALLGIDELNIISEDDSSSTALGGTIDLSSQIGDALSEYEKVWDKAFESMQNKAQYYADQIGKTFDKLKEKFAPITNVWKSVDWDTIIQNLKDFWTAIQPYADEFGNGIINFFADVSDIAADALEGILGKDGILRHIINTLNSGNPENAEKWGEGFAALATSVLLFKAGTDVFNACLTIAALVSNWQLLLGFGIVALVATITVKGYEYFKQFKADVENYKVDPSNYSGWAGTDADVERARKRAEFAQTMHNLGFISWDEAMANLKENWGLLTDSMGRAYDKIVKLITKLQVKADVSLSNLRKSISDAGEDIDAWWYSFCDNVVLKFNSAIHKLKQMWNNFAEFVNKSGLINLPTFDLSNYSTTHLSSSGTSYGGSSGNFGTTIDTTPKYSSLLSNGFSDMVQLAHTNTPTSTTYTQSIASEMTSAIVTELQKTRQTVSGLNLSVNIGDVEIAKANARGSKRIGAALIR